MEFMTPGRRDDDEVSTDVFLATASFEFGCSNVLSFFATLVFNLHAHTRHVMAVRIAFLPKAHRQKNA